MFRITRLGRGVGGAVALAGASAAAFTLATRARSECVAAAAVPSTTGGFRLDGRIALVTGASRGLGFVMAHALAEHGAHVVLAGRDPQTLEAARCRILAESPTVSVSTVAFDVSSPDECAAAVADVVRVHGRVDVLVNNAGVNYRRVIEEFSTKGFHGVLQTNLVGPFVLARECAIHMRRHGWGRIINVGSVMSHVGRAGLHAYVASKHGLEGLTKSLASELGTDGITVNCIGPGFFKTELTAGLRANASFEADISGRTPIGRWGSPTELAGPCVFLASEASSYVNGVTLVVDGGMIETLHAGGADWRVGDAITGAAGR